MVTSVKRIHRTAVDAVATLIDEELTTIATVHVPDFESVCMHFAVEGNDLDQFDISANSIKDGTFEILYSTTEDFIAPEGIMMGSSGDLTNLQNGARGWLLFYPHGFFSLRVRAARKAGANADVTIQAGGS